MKAVKPFGDPETAKIMVIGHDPRLQRTQTQADVAFFMDYLKDVAPGSRSEASKYGLAKALWDYVADLAGGPVALSTLYVTNLCNEFLEHIPGSGTVLIPDEKARQGVEAIARTIASGSFSLILPMAVQPFYHLCQLGFLDEDSEVIKAFIAGARADPGKAARGIYVQGGRAPFLAVCGRRFHHRGVPVIPVVHVKQWPLKPRMARYTEPMQRARQQAQAVLRTEPG
jgi:hypothetical protein